MPSSPSAVFLFLLFFALSHCGPQPCREVECSTQPVVPPPSSCEPASLPHGKNLLKNSGFECGDALEGWSSQFGTSALETTLVRSGKQAARLFTTEDRTVVALSFKEPVVKAPKEGTTYCAYAYVKGSASDVRVSIRRVGSNFDETFSSPISPNEWTQVPPSSYGGVPATAKSDTELYFRIFIPNAKPNDFIVIDDVQFWESTTGNCK